MQTPHEIHRKEVKKKLWYVWGTVQFGIHYSSKGTPLLVGFTDSYWVGDLDDRNSIVGYVFIFGSVPTAWADNKQQVISISSVEAEYRAMANERQESLWIQRILSEFGF
jgi:hypothetical protein